jgi:hypothetical protein
VELSHTHLSSCCRRLSCIPRLRSSSAQPSPFSRTASVWELDDIVSFLRDLRTQNPTTLNAGVTDVPPLGVAGTLLWTSNAAVVLLYNIFFVFYSLISAWNSPAPDVTRGYYNW